MNYRFEFKNIRKLIEKRDKKAIILLVIGIGLLVFCLAKIMMPLMLALLFFVLLYRYSKKGNKDEKKK